MGNSPRAPIELATATAPNLRWPTLALVATLLAVVAASTVAGVVGIQRVDHELERVMVRDVEQLVEVTHVRRLFRSELVVLSEWDHSRDPLARAAGERKLEELQRERGERLARLQAIAPAEVAQELDELVQAHAGGRRANRVGERRWEGAIAAILAAVERDLERSTARGRRITEVSEAILIAVSALAVVLGLVFGGLAMRRVRVTNLALRDAAQRLHAIVEAAPSLLIELNSRGELRFLPDCGPHFLGVTAAALGADPLCWVATEDRDDLQSAVATALTDAPSTAPLLVRGVRGDDTRWDASVSFALTHDAHAAVDSLLLQILDVTATRLAEEKRGALEEQLQRSQRAASLGQLAGGLAHDFSNLLTAIKGTASLLAEDLPQGSLHADLVSEIDQAADRGTALTRQLRDFSHSGRVNPVTTDPVEFVHHLERLLGAAVGRHVQVAIAAAPDLGTCLVDPGQLSQALLNLVINAAHAMDHEGTVRIGFRHVMREAASVERFPDVAPGRFLELTVTDSGPGIAPELRDRIFEPFFSTKGSAGSGLGLAMVERIVRGHRGFVDVESSPGDGATFRLHFPCPPPPTV